MTDHQPTMQPGWYPDPMQPGHQREWNGNEWVGPSVKDGAKGGFPKWLIPVIACLALGIVAVIIGAVTGSPEEEDVSSDRTTSTVSQESPPQTEDTSEPAEPEETTTEAPTTTEEPTTTTTEAPPQPIVQTGQGDGQTPPLDVPAGNYAVHYQFDGTCFYGGTLVPIDSADPLDFPQDLGTGTGPVAGDTNIYDVPGGTYYVKMITGPAPGCPWTVTLTPQG